MNALVFIMILFCFGFSGCDNRTKIIIYRFNLSMCPENRSLPGFAKNGEWELKTSEPSISCPNSTYYFESDEQWRSNSFGLPKAVNLYARLIKESSCSLLLAYPFDISTNPEKVTKIQSEEAANALIKALNSDIQITAKSFEIVTSDNFKSLCQ